MCRTSNNSVYRERLHSVLPVIASIVSIVLGACASGGAVGRAEQGAADNGEASSSAAAPTHVVVNNQSWARVTVYISQGTGTWRLGEVEAQSQRALPLGTIWKSLLNGTVYFVARPLAGTAFRSETFEVSPGGGTPVWTIENHTAASFVTVR